MNLLKKCKKHLGINIIPIMMLVYLSTIPSVRVWAQTDQILIPRIWGERALLVNDSLQGYKKLNQDQAIVIAKQDSIIEAKFQEVENFKKQVLLYKDLYSASREDAHEYRNQLLQTEQKLRRRSRQAKILKPIAIVSLIINGVLLLK